MAETVGLIEETYQRADAFLFGRRTYDLFAGYWGALRRLGRGPEARAAYDRAVALIRRRDQPG